MTTFDIWDLTDVHVVINDNFLDKLNKEISIKFEVKRNFYNSFFIHDNLPFYVFKNMLKKSYYHTFFVPLSFLLKVCENLNFSREDLQKNITSYKSQGSINFIEKPKLPIEINPVFDMIYAHNIGDGTVSVAKNKAPYFAYRQFNEFYRNAYLKKIESIFGEIHYKNKEFKELTRVRCPTVLSSLFFKYYKLNDRGFMSDTARLSFNIFDKGKESMLAVLVAFIIDEGHIDSTQITIVLKNPLLIEDLKMICDALGYKSSVVHKKGDYKDYSGINILRDGMKSFYRDYLEIHNRYPVIDLGIKGDRIKQSFYITNRKIKRVRGNQEAILSILKNERLSVNQLANRTLMTRQGVRYHIHTLLKKGKIKLIDDSQLNWTYGA